MYESFYGLKEKPFSLLPDPAYLYLSKQHEMAITLLQYSLENQAGFCVISGKAGTGKTTLVRRLLNQIGDDVSVGLISNTHHSFGELMRWILHAFGLDGAGMTRAETHRIFVDYLITQYAKNRRSMLIIDEAQNMAVDALEELRMLSNINSEKDLLLQVILVGQPPLRDILQRPELEQFAQRIAVDYHLDSLSAEETRGYIRHRIVIAGGEPDLFTEDACDTIYEYCGGNPRLINLLCDLSLVYAYASQAAVVTGELVEQVVTEREKYGALPSFVSIKKTLADPDATAAMTPIVARARIAHKTDGFGTATEAHGVIPVERGNATRLPLRQPIGDFGHAGKILPGNAIPAETGPRAREIPAAVRAGGGQPGTVNIPPGKPKQGSGAEPSAIAQAPAASIRGAPDSMKTKKAQTRNVMADGVPMRKPDHFTTPSSPVGGDKQINANNPSQSSYGKSGRVKHSDVRAVKSNETAAGIAAKNRDRPALGRRRRIVAAVVIGLWLAVPLVWYFAKQQLISIHEAPIAVLPSPVNAATPAADAAPAKVMPTSESLSAVKSSEEISPVDKQETEAALAQKDLEERARLKSVERERAAETIRLAETVAAVLDKKPGPVPPFQAPVPADRVVSRPARPAIAPEMAGADAGDDERTDKPAYSIVIRNGGH